MCGGREREGGGEEVPPGFATVVPAPYTLWPPPATATRTCPSLDGRSHPALLC